MIPIPPVITAADFRRAQHVEQPYICPQHGGRQADPGECRRCRLLDRSVTVQPYLAAPQKAAQLHRAHEALVAHIRVPNSASPLHPARGRRR